MVTGWIYIPSEDNTYYCYSDGKMAHDVELWGTWRFDSHGVGKKILQKGKGMDSTSLIISLVGSLLASTGFWTFMSKHVGNNGVNRKQNNMLIGLAHDRIIELGIKYLERGYITTDEYENLYKYL